MLLRLTILAFAALTLAGPAGAYLAVHPENPHYFLETTTGKPVMITGCWGPAPTALNYNYAKDIKELKDNQINYGRVWHFLPWEGKNATWPWGRSNVSGAPMGGNKIDMSAWNPTYWFRLTDAMRIATEAVIYMEIHLFDRCGMSPADKTRWQGNPWASDNNVNNLETPVASKDGTPDFYMYEEKPNLRAQQERYVTKMIDETIKYPVVIYEIENEHWQYTNPKFGAHYAQFVKDYIAKNYPKEPRLVSYSSLENDLESFYKIPYVDIVNKHYGKEPQKDLSVLNTYIEPRWKLNKAINIDEFANGLGDPDIMRKMCWIIITSGGNFHIEGSVPSAKPLKVCANIELFKKKSGWDFVHSAPDKSLVKPGGYCLANLGTEYVCYFPTGGNKSVSVPAGQYRFSWWDTVRGRFTGGAAFTMREDGNRKFTTPSQGDWVLLIKKAPDRN